MLEKKRFYVCHRKKEAGAIIMKLTIALIDSVLIRKGSKTLSEMDAYSKAPRKANEELLMRILQEKGKYW